MRSLFSLVFLLVATFVFFPQQLTGSYYGTINPYVDNVDKFVSVSSFTFKGNRYEFTTGVDRTKAEKEIPKDLVVDGYYDENGEYSITDNDGIRSIEFRSDSNFTYKKKLGILFNARRMFLYENNVLFFEPDEDLRWEGSMPRITEVRPSSFLVEGKTHYDGSSFIPLKTKYYVPWVEGKPDYGIGEYIEIQIEQRSLPISSFIVSNGYVNFEKPNLYRQNSRIRKIRVTSEEAKLDFVATLNDSPDLQIVNFPKAIVGPKLTFRIVILEVYKGEKWSDTCLNLIVPMAELPGK